MRPRLDGHARSRMLAAALVVALAAIAYAPLPGNGFVRYDDDEIVFENPGVTAGLGAAAVDYAFTNRKHYFQPLSFLSLAADRSLFGLDPRAFHAVNWLFHVTSALVVLWALAAATGRLGAATAVALLFAVHPVNVEAVAWAAERRTVLAGLLGLASFVLYASWCRTRSASRYALALLAFGLSLLAKPMMVPLPIMLLALDVWPLRRAAAAGGARWTQLAVEKVPFAALSAASALMTVASIRVAGIVGDPEARGLALRAANAVVVVFRHLGHLAVPRDLTAFYPYPDHPPAAWPLALAAAIGVTVAAVRLRERAPWWLAGWCWFLAALLPTLGFRQAGTWAALADRHAYIAALGPIAAVCFQVDAWLAPRGDRVRRAVAAAAVACCVVLAALAARQVGVWRDNLTLFTRAVAYAPDEPMLRSNLGAELALRGDLGGSEHHLAAAAQGCLDRPGRCPEPQKVFRNLSTVYVRTGRVEDAIHAARMALRFDPRNPATLLKLARLLHQAGRFPEAVPLYEAVVRVAPPTDDARATALQMLRLAPPRAQAP